MAEERKNIRQYEFAQFQNINNQIQLRQFTKQFVGQPFVSVFGFSHVFIRLTLERKLNFKFTTETRPLRLHFSENTLENLESFL